MPGVRIDRLLASTAAILLLAGTASIASAEVESVYVVWGVTEINGLTIDGAAATPHSLVASGPEDLVREAATLVRSQLGLNEDERKN